MSLFDRQARWGPRDAIVVGLPFATTLGVVPQRSVFTPSTEFLQIANRKLLDGRKAAWL
ncbi:MAG: hypothetical protein IT423_04435 [Pirellulaceae bacterium]|nr:hypothetical protein [Pirellulaceae bacterium]